MSRGEDSRGEGVATGGERRTGGGGVRRQGRVALAAGLGVLWPPLRGGERPPRRPMVPAEGGVRWLVLPMLLWLPVVVAAADLDVRAAAGGEMLLRVLMVVVVDLALPVLAPLLPRRSLEPDGGVAPVRRAVLEKDEDMVEVKVLLLLVVAAEAAAWSVPASTQRTASATSQLLFLMISEAGLVRKEEWMGSQSGA